MRLADEWAEFEQKVLSGASPIQREEMQKAFYAGAATMMGLMVKITSSPMNNPTQLEKECAKLDAINVEIEGFFGGLT